MLQEGMGLLSKAGRIYLAALLSAADLQYCCVPTDCPIPTQGLGNPK